MSLLPAALVGLLTLLVLHALVGPALHLLAHVLYRGRNRAGAERGRARVAFLLLASSPLLVAVVGLSGLGHLAEGPGSWATLLAACRDLHDHCDLLLSGASAEGLVYGGILVGLVLWLARAIRRSVAPLAAVAALPRATLTLEQERELDRAATGLSCPVEVVECPGLALSAGFLRPRVLISGDLLDSLPPAQLRAVLAHEAEHVRAHDALRGLAIRFAASLSPHVGWSCRAERAYELDREILCDQAAVRRGADPLELAAALVTVARMRAMDPPACPAATGTHDVDRAVQTRVRLLLDPERPQPSGRAPVVLSSAAVLLLAAALPHLAFELVVSVHCGVEALVHLLA